MGLGQHSCGDCKLSCVDCSAQICPGCMVQCPVGNRCPKCAGKFTSHVLAVTPLIMIKTLAAAGVAGFAFGWADTFLPLGGLFMMFFVYLGGVGIGNVVHKVSGHKMGPKISMTVVAGLVVGALLSPVGERALSVYQSVTDSTKATPAASPPQSEHEVRLVMAATQARETYPDFELAYKNKTGEAHSLKFPFTTGGITEHLWVAIDDIEGTTITGTLENDPMKLKSIKAGDKVTRDVSELEDWMYKDTEGSHGGFTTRLSQRNAHSQAQEYASYEDEYGPEALELGKQARTGWLFSSLISLAIFAFGVVSPFMGISPIVSGRNWFRR